ncbi:MAG: hypothetical protein M1833_003425 [Piccolia ochrophora]|nr:MAG: hypothetical protein M1833_003425 [Piccolia ochrophora]
MASKGEQLIFAPGSSTEPQRAAQFAKSALSRESLSPSPITQFHEWFRHAQEFPTPTPETCTFSTAALPSGRVSARMVYLKELSPAGFVIYSNWDTSRKAADVASNPHAALTFHWRELERQVRIEGRFERLSKAESQRYYDTRERGSRVGAWASPQSAVLNDRAELDERVKAVEERFDGLDDIPVPDFWGGGRVVPDEVEFWQGRQGRLHDRFRYTWVGPSSSRADNGQEGKDVNDDGWRVERLSP